MRNFGLIGVAGFVAKRHLESIKDTNNNLITCLDPNDSVGIIDSYFPEASFFTEPERFERHIDRLNKRGTKLDYLSICSPNYLHDAHIRMGLKNNIDVICEKPLVVNPKNLDLLEALEEETGKKINNILQLRLHDSIINLKNSVDKNRIYDIDLTYITSRGLWYQHSWKSDLSKSGGLCMNIGIHFFDMLIWIFGQCLDFKVYERTNTTVSGYLLLERAKVRWFLSIDKNTLPKSGIRMFRSIKIDDKELEFSNGFGDLHTKSYQKILDGQGFGIKDAKGALCLSSDLMKKDIDEVVDLSCVHPHLGIK
jgi:UDP-N-acetyl-2-amino-2-deoxyglucuronate dehydrogenase